MEWFDRLFRRAPKNSKWAPTFDGFAPIYSQFGTNIYASDVVQQALKCIVDEIKKLNPTHIRYKGSDPLPVQSTVQDVLDNPNQLMTTSEFLEKTCWLLLLNYNAFILPTYYTWVDEKTGAERRYYQSLYPINPTQVDFIEDATGRLFVTFWFWNGKQTTIPYDDVIHIRYNYSVSDYMGGNRLGQPDNEALLKTLELNHSLLQGVAKAMKASYAVNGIIKINSIIDREKSEEAAKQLKRQLDNNESGVIVQDMKGDFQPFDRKIALVDKTTLEFIDSKILRNWGVPVDILMGKFSTETYNAFYQKTLEPIVKSMAQALTKGLFTPRERSFKNKIELYPKELINLSPQQTIEVINTLAPQGGGYVNEYRTWLGLRPLPELEGKRFMSLNWIDADNAAQYQVGNVNVDVVDENKTETITED